MVVEGTCYGALVSVSACRNADSSEDLSFRKSQHMVVKSLDDKLSEKNYFGHFFSSVTSTQEKQLRRKEDSRLFTVSVWGQRDLLL